MVEVFKTNIAEPSIADAISNTLLTHLPNSNINFDLEDCDKILRIENGTVNITQVIHILKQKGFYCERLY